ncbi:cell division site-positioning protein MapZ family protein [Lactococcus termiticola]|uniref:Mid-cell-anchored protein Z n=1 Tax=Lactococcus termiticola TaxID=2169526 RepID=A0A2R5HH01_9LACT|nr:cell division site-positioning protein MapZ family protein [Lactococcus termiticola]GBG97136.1 hypothetical protein NtB2_01273 [Lactococcus termiticola]
MSKKKNKNHNTNKKKQAEKVLKMEDASNLTVGEVLEKTEAINQENAGNANPLDKYIQSHRKEIEEAKNRDLDSFISGEREKVEAKKAGNKEAVKKAAAILGLAGVEAGAEAVKATEEAKKEELQPESKETKTDSADAKSAELDKVEVEDKGTEKAVAGAVAGAVAMDEVKVSADAEKPKETVSKDEAPAEAEESSKDSAESEAPSKEAESQGKKSKKAPIIIAAAAVLVLGAGAFGISQSNLVKGNKPVSTTSTSNKSMSDFFNHYKAFFSDDKQTMLLNSKFDKLPDLEKEISALKDSDQPNAKAEYKNLKEQIDAIKEVNALFDKPALVDGKLDSTAKVKDGVSIPEMHNTSNVVLNKLLSQVIEQAKSQQAQAKTAASQAAEAKASSEAAAAAAQATASQQEAEQAESSTTTSQSDQSSSQTSEVTASAGSTAQNPTGVAVDNASARVQPQAGVDTSDPAFNWAPGVLENILNICRQRGYFTGDNYILQPVAIHTTKAGVVSGYYNLYKADGSYLVSINCKTGYWFGTSKGLPLDY